MNTRMNLFVKILFFLLSIFSSTSLRAGMGESITVNTVEGVPMTFVGLGIASGFGQDCRVYSIPKETVGPVTIPAEVNGCIVDGIYSSAFKDCTGVTSIYIPSSITSIMQSAFEGCTSLSSIVIPSSVTNIEIKALAGCNSLESITVDSGNTKYDSRENCNAIISTSNNNMIIGCKNSFIPSSITKIHWYAFYNCKGLTGICIPNTITEIGDYTFYGCDNLTNVVSEIKTPFKIPNNAFPYSTATLRVPYGTISQYKVIDGWKMFKIIVESDEMDNGDLFYETNQQGLTMTFKVMDKATRKCQLGDGTTAAVMSPLADKLIIPDIVKDYKVVAIGNESLSGCPLLKMISFPTTLETLNDNVLKDCLYLTAIQWNAEFAFPLLSLGKIKNPNLLLYVKHKDFAPTGIQNVVVNGVADKIVLQEATNGNDFYCPEEFTALNIEFTHNYSMTSGYQTNQGWETIALPFDVTNITYDTTTELVPIKTWEVGSTQRPFWLYEQTTEGWKAATAIKGNVPYIICIPNNPEHYEDLYNIKGNITFKGTNVRVMSSDNIITTMYNNRRFVPNYQNQQASNDIYALNVNNQWDSYTSPTYNPGSTFFPNFRAVHPFEAYMTMEGGVAAPEFIPIFENGTTGISDAMRLNDKSEMSNGKWYTLDGRKLQQRPERKGLYIVNGCKIVIK